MTRSSEYDKDVNLMQDQVRLSSEEYPSRKRLRYEEDVNPMQDQVGLSSEENPPRKRLRYDENVNLMQNVRHSSEGNRYRKRQRYDKDVNHMQDQDWKLAEAFLSFGILGVWVSMELGDLVRMGGVATDLIE
ncbi:hypothetical protein FF1_002652 [Malus domestica]